MACAMCLSGCGRNASVYDNSSAMNTSVAYDSMAFTGASSQAVSYSQNKQEYEFKESADVDSVDLDGVATDGAKLIRNVYIDMETTDLDKVVSEMKGRTAGCGGYIQNVQVYNYSSRRDYNLDIRIPYAKVDTFLEGIEEYGVINDISDNTQDVTLTYAGIETRLKNLNTQHQRLLELLENAETLTDVIALEERLSDVETELDTFTLEIKNYDNLINYSTVSVRISEYDYVSSPVDKSVFGRIKSGMSDNLHDMKEDFVDFLVWFIVHIPNIIIFSVWCTLAVFIVRKIRKLGFLKKIRQRKDRHEK